MVDESWDVVVIGGGPGGSTTAAFLAMRGRRVLVLERVRFPRFHIGESLLPSSFPVLRALGVEEELDRRFYRKYGARFLDDARGADFSDEDAQAQYRFDGAFPPSIPYAWEVSRDDFDAVLLDCAKRKGAEVREAWAATDVLFEASRVCGVVARDERGSLHRIRARVVVDATGRDGLLTRARGSMENRERIPQLDKTAIFTHVEGGHRNEGIDVGQIEIIILAGKNDDQSTPGWAWFIPFKDGRSSVGFVLSSDVVRRRITDAKQAIVDGRRLEAIFAQEVERSPWMKRLIGDAPRCGPVRAAADYSFRATRLAGDGWLAVGDAAGFLDPLFSTGAHLAMGGGVRAADAIDAALATSREGVVREESFAPYVTAIRAATDLFLGAVQSFYRGELRALLFAKDQRSALRKTITSMLAGDVFHEGPTPALWVGYFRERFPAT